jgi:hypothetical protein
MSIHKQNVHECVQKKRKTKKKSTYKLRHTVHKNKTKYQRNALGLYVLHKSRNTINCLLRSSPKSVIQISHRYLSVVPMLQYQPI